MTAPVTCALLQLCSGRDMARNIAETTDLIRVAAAQSAQFVLTPEMTNIIEPDRPRLRSLVKPEVEDDGVKAFAACARDLNIWLLIGSLALKGENGNLVNRSLLFAPNGDRIASYDKIHLFDVDLPTGERIRESEAYEGGGDATVVPTPWGNVGLTICYDVRFPSLYRQLAQHGADFLTVPSAFTVPTGEAHWHVLLRARAIETGAYVLAAAQTGEHDSGRRTYGHSLVVSPWGDVIADAGKDKGITLAVIDREDVRKARARIPGWSGPDTAPLKAQKPVAS